MWYNYVSVKET